MEKLLKILYDQDIVEEDAFSEYREADDDDHIPGKMKLLVQCTEFFAWLDEPEESDEDEEGEEEEVDDEA